MRAASHNTENCWHKRSKVLYAQKGLMMCGETNLAFRPSTIHEKRDVEHPIATGRNHHIFASK